MWGVQKVQQTSRAQYRFGEYHLDIRDRLLTRNGSRVRLEPKSFDVLQHLLQNAGHLVSKQDLVEAVWTRSFVSDNSLTRCIHQVRAALEDDAEQPKFIETVPGTGYRFIAPVDVDTESAAPAQQRSGRKRRMLIFAAIIIALAGGGLLLARWVDSTSDIPTVERIAVLPLVNLTGEPAQEYFVEGVHDALIAELSRAASIDVISRTSVMGFRNTKLSVPEIAEALDVDALVEGSVMRTGNNLTVTAQLIATNPERHLWADRYHRDVSELFDITTSIVAAIASEIAIEVSPDHRVAAAGAMPMNSEAYEAYLLGRFHFEQRTAEGYRLAREQFRKAIELDPEFAPPYVGLAHTFGSAAIFGLVQPADGFPEARRLAERAVALDSTLAEGHLILAGVSFYWDWNLAEAERTANYALRLNPNLANAYRFLAEIYSATGRHAEALAAVERAREIDPLPPTAQFKPSLILYLGRDFDQAIARAERALLQYPRFWQGHWLLCMSLAATRRFDEAVAECRQAAELSGGTPMAVGGLGYALALAGLGDEAAGIAANLELRRQSEYVGPASIAIIYAALGRMDEAFENLGSAYALHDQQLVHAGNAAYFDLMRTDGRFQALRNGVLATSSGHNRKVTAK